MPAPLTDAIGAPAEQQHSYQPGDKWNRTNPTDTLDISPSGKPLQHRRHPKPKGIATGIGKKQTDRKQQNCRMPQCLPNCDVLDVRHGTPLFSEAASQPVTFIPA